MTDKSLQDKAISIKGKEYIQVSDRILFFNAEYPKGCIKTALVSKPEDQMVVIKAQVIPDITTPDRYFTGYSQAKWGDGMVNKTAAMENAETSAVGRALGMMGIGVIDTVASVDEMNKAGVTKPAYQPSTPTAMCAIHKVSMKQFEKNGKKWFSHKLDDGTWCNGAPPKKVQTQPENHGYDGQFSADDVADDVPF